MGLDITHYKATLEKAQEHHLFYIGEDIYSETGAEIREKFDSFNVDFDHFSKYIQEIEVPTKVESIIIIKGSENEKKVKAHFKSNDSNFLIRENEEQLERELKDFEKKKGYQNLKKCFDDSHNDWIIVKYYTTEKKEGFYFKSVGEQRMSMNDKFWNKFCNENTSNFALEEDFKFALSCVDHYRDSDTKEIVNLRKDEFKKTFIDNFELGASFMSVSY
ncbi:hypothetical protein FIA58_011340 [Flavobacterium jejuense]|uniref:Uncharacterized protein n=1 Tax=Flavobacterium jejuense TaxID=1544455 RepID=A0ABX0IQY5_9FLAO|nr:hypothetical protein [Flavobacterium jejuense]NHN26272.1 hypothetical protein [Flavobacterium jejuense]